MESRYLYRAKRIDNGEWETGYLVCTVDGSYIMSDRGNINQVDHTTICQCSGLKDDADILIFENDVLSLTDEINEFEWKAVVKFGTPNEEYKKYTWGWQLVPITKCDDIRDILEWIETEMSYRHCKVIGNLFENSKMKNSELKKYLDAFPDDVPVSVMLANLRKSTLFGLENIMSVTDIGQPVFLIDAGEEFDMEDPKKKGWRIFTKDLMRKFIDKERR